MTSSAVAFRTLILLVSGHLLRRNAVVSWRRPGESGPMCHWEFSQMCDMTDWSKLCDKSRNRCPFPRLVGSRYTLSPSSRLPDECNNIALPGAPPSHRAHWLQRVCHQASYSPAAHVQIISLFENLSLRATAGDMRDRRSRLFQLR